MIEVIFAIVFGLSIASTVIGMVAHGSRADVLSLKILGTLAVLSTLTLMFQGENVHFLRQMSSLFFDAFLVRPGWLIFGGVIALLMQIHQEGYFYDLWVRYFPETAPTTEARAGQRSMSSGFRKTSVPSTLVGTSTAYLTENLDLKTDTLVRLAFYAFEDRSARTVTYLESALKLGTGRRQREFLKLAGNTGRRPNPKQVVHRYYRSVNGSSRMAQALFGELCHLAHLTQNLDRASVERLKKVGSALKLSTDEMGQSLSFMR